jgi:hypothetical protein
MSAFGAKADMIFTAPNARADILRAQSEPFSPNAKIVVWKPDESIFWICDNSILGNAQATPAETLQSELSFIKQCDR